MSFIDHCFAALACAVIAVVAASVISLHKRSKILQSLVACAVAGLCGAVEPSLISGMAFVPQNSCYAMALFTGFLAYGILGWIDKKSDQLPDADILGPLSGLFRKGKDKTS